MSRGRRNPRHNGGVGMDIGTAMGFLAIGVVAGSVLSAQVGAWVQHRVMGSASPSSNPFMTFGEFLGGHRSWSMMATVVVVAAWLTVAVVGGIVWWALRRWRQPATRVDTAAKYLADSSDIQSLSRGKAEEGAKKWLPHPELAKSHPGLRFGKVPGTRTGLYSTWEDLYLVIRPCSSAKDLISRWVDAVRDDLFPETRVSISAQRCLVFELMMHGFLS